MLDILKKILKSTIRRFGYDITNVRNQSFGINIWNDIERLSIAYRKSNQVAFDVGANVGSTSKELLKHFKGCRIYAFEPHPITFKKLESNIASTRFFPVQLAFSDVSGEKNLYDYGDESVINSLTPNAQYAVRFDKKATELLIVTKTIDEFCSEKAIQKIDILKVDTEGHDFNVIKGAERMLASNSITFVYFEFNDFLPRPGTEGGSLNEITNYLSNFGFQFVATYTDYIVTERKIFVVANVLLFNPN